MTKSCDEFKHPNPKDLGVFRCAAPFKPLKSNPCEETTPYGQQNEDAQIRFQADYHDRNRQAQAPQSRFGAFANQAQHQIADEEQQRRAKRGQIRCQEDESLALQVNSL